MLLLSQKPNVRSASGQILVTILCYFHFYQKRHSVCGFLRRGNVSHKPEAQTFSALFRAVSLAPKAEWGTEGVD